MARRPETFPRREGGGNPAGSRLSRGGHRPRPEPEPEEGLPNDAEGRVLEDALCLVFLEHQFGDLASKTTEDKMINALQKAWKKMTPAGAGARAQAVLSPQQQSAAGKGADARGTETVAASCPVGAGEPASCRRTRFECSNPATCQRSDLSAASRWVIEDRG